MCFDWFGTQTTQIVAEPFQLVEDGKILNCCYCEIVSFYLKVPPPKGCNSQVSVKNLRNQVCNSVIFQFNN